MKTKKVIKTNLEGIQLGYLDEDMKEVKLVRRDDLEAFPKNEQLYILMEAIAGTIEMLVNAITCDLREIWERLDTIEERSEPRIKLR